MKNHKIPIAAVLLLGFMAGCDDPSKEIEPDSSQTPIVEEVDSYPSIALSEDLQSAVVFLREEEKLARDVYSELNKQYNSKSFANISKSEQQHMDAILAILNKYDLEDPVTNQEIGSFKNEELQKLYSDLMGMGLANLESAYKVGCAIEEIDILDIQNLILLSDGNGDIEMVFDNLLRGSRNHLRAFVNNLRNLGITYEPQYLTKEAYDAIVNSEIEKGN